MSLNILIIHEAEYCRLYNTLTRYENMVYTIRLEHSVILIDSVTVHKYYAEVILTQLQVTVVVSDY